MSNRGRWVQALDYVMAKFCLALHAGKTTKRVCWECGYRCKK
jgi:hypothetical protein